MKGATVNGRTEEETNAAIRQIVESAIAPDGVIDIFAAAGLEKPDISILSDAFLAEVRDMSQRNLVVELLRWLLEARRGEDFGLTDDELAFYDALETNDSAVAFLGDETLRTIARELVDLGKANTTIDWTVRENVRARAHLRVLVKSTLRKYGYPPDLQERATGTVLEQGALLSAEWAVASGAGAVHEPVPAN